MKLTATPFDAETGELLPVYRDAYLRGDLARSSAQAVEDYLRRDAVEAHSVVTRWHQLQAVEDTTVAPNWVGRQMQFVREQPQRFRRRAMSFGLIGLMLAGASMAANHLPTSKLPLAKLPVAAIPMSASMASMSATTAASPAVSAPLVAASEIAEAGKMRTVLLHGRILNEKGQPLAGATVLQKGTSHGTSTDASGNYSLRVPAGSQATLQYGYGGYAEQEMSAASTTAEPVVLQPKQAKHKHWLFF